MPKLRISGNCPNRLGLTENFRNSIPIGFGIGGNWHTGKISRRKRPRLWISFAGGSQIQIRNGIFVSAKLGLRLTFTAEQVIVVWPATGIALSAVILFGNRIWPFIAVGAFIANITTDAPPLTAFGIATGNTLEAIVGAYLLTRFVRFRPQLERFRDVFGLIFFAAMVSTLVSATIGVTSLCLTGMQPWKRFGFLWFEWFLGDALGDVLVAPLVLTLSSAESRAQGRTRTWEFAALIVTLSTVGWTVFAGSIAAGARYSPRAYTVFPGLIWAALRFGPCGSAIGTFLTATRAVVGTAEGFGPFVAGSIEENLIALQLFMFVAAATSLVMAASQMERASAFTLLRESDRRKDEFLRLLEAAPDAIVIVGTDGNIALVNAQTERVFSYAREELIGQPVEKLVPERFRAAHTGHRNRYFGHPGVRPMGPGLELYGLRKDGSEFPVEISLSPLETDEGLLAMAAIRDITERTAAENRFRSLLESAPDAMVIADERGQPDSVAPVTWACAATLGKSVKAQTKQTATRARNSSGKPLIASAVRRCDGPPNATMTVRDDRQQGTRVYVQSPLIFRRVYLSNTARFPLC